MEEISRMSIQENQKELKQGLSGRHVQFIALAGMIGTGIFKGSAETLQKAGPAVVFAYLAGGLLLLIVMTALAEMALAHPKHNVQMLIHKAMGSRSAFVTGWLYWVNWVIVTTVEIVAAGSFLQYWFDMPLWVLSLICGVLIIAINLTQVKNYGELEFWFAGIKITTLILFIILGACLIFGIVPSSAVSPAENLTGNGGFMPFGLTGVASAFLVVVFSYGGAELVGVAVTETKDVEKILPRVIRGTVFRVITFYIFPILIICALIPWNSVTGEVSPFVQVFDMLHIPAAADIMNFVLLTAVLSAANSGIYATSRTLYSMSRSGEAPAKFGELSNKGVPRRGILMTSIFIFLGVLVAFLTESRALNLLMQIPGFTIMIVWLAICVSQIILRKRSTEIPSFKVWFFPFTTIFAIVCFSIIFISSLLNTENLVGSSVCVGIMVILIVVAFIHDKYKKQSR